MEYHKRKPDFVIEVIRPDYDYKPSANVDYEVWKSMHGPYRHTVVAKFISSTVKVKSDVISNACISYSFGESLATIDSDFSLLLTLEEDSKGKTWLDKLKPLDLVFIYEFGEQRFGGYIESISYNAKVGGEGKVLRAIDIAGGGMGRLLASFRLVLDQFLYQGSGTALSASKQLLARLSSKMDVGTKFSDILEAIYESYFKLVLEMGEVNKAGQGIKNILDRYIDYKSELSDEVVIQYPMNLSLYNTGLNSIWDIWSSIIHPPINELFGRWNYEKCRFSMVFRRAPFDKGDWKSLKINEIPSLMIDQFNIGLTNREVFTYYLGYLPGSGISKEKAMVIDQEGYGNCAIIDEQRWKKYGYRPLIIEHKFFNRDQVETYTSSVQLMRELSGMVKDWYEKNDEFYSGNITMMTVDPKQWGGRLLQPRIGERIGFLGGEFYLEKSQHSWVYGGPMSTNLSLTRGYLYNGDGSLRGKIDYIGSRVKSVKGKIA